VVAQRLAEVFGQPFVVDNRPGAGGAIGTEAVVKAPPDGYTLLAASSGPISIMPNLQKTPYEPLKDLAPVSLTARAPFALVTSPAFPANNAKEFVALVRANPDKYAFSSSGTGATAHLFTELFNSMAGIKARHVPYKGSAPAIADLLAGRVQVMFDNTTSSLPQVRSGKLRALAVAERTRLKAAPEIPTVDESGVKGFEATPWFGVVTRAGTPKETVDRLAAQIGEIVRRPDVDARFAALGVELKGTTPEAFAAHIERELAKWDRIVKQSGAKLD